MAGFTGYFRFILRRERIMSAIWAAALILFTYAIAAYYPSLFPDEASIAGMAEMFKSPAMVGMMGPVYGEGLPSVAMLFSQEMSVWMFIAVAVMNIFFVNRHTRADEERGRLEMFIALPVGRNAGAASVMTAVLALNGIIALFTLLLIPATGMTGGDFTGAAAYALAVFGVGIFFASVTLLFAQLFSTSRSASGAAFAVLGLSYILRAAGDMGNSALSFISPLGLGLRVFAFYENNFWCIVALLLESIVLLAIAFVILSRRDHGAGVIPAKSGRAEASRALKSPLGLAWRLTRNSSIIWCAAIFIMGAMYGTMFGEIEEFAAQNDYYKMIIAGGTDITASLIDSFAAFLLAIMSLFSAIPVINIAGRLHAEEKRGRLEPVLARSVSRRKMFGAYILIAVIMTVAAQLCAVIGVFSTSGGLVSFSDMFVAGLSYIPALLFMLGLMVFLVGAFPRLRALSWLVYGYSVFAAIFLRMLDLPDFLSKLSPFGNIPQLPVEEFSAVPLAILVILAALLTALGLWRFSKRDVQ